MTDLTIISRTDEPKKFHPFCKACGWRKGGPDSWNGTSCKCGLTAGPIKPIICATTAGDDFPIPEI